MLKISFDQEKMVEPSRHINRNMFISDLAAKSFDDVVKIFKERIHEFYIEQGEHILSLRLPDGTANPHFDFILLTISITVIDLLSQYENNLIESKGNEFKSYLRNKISNEFSKPFKNSGFIKFFDSRPKGSKKPNFYCYPVNSSEISDYADAFWIGFRNGIVHNAMILPFGRINRGPIGIFKEDLWDKTRKLIQITVNPKNLFKRVLKIFDDYISRLLVPSNNNLRNDFKNKFLRDFGWKIP